MKALAESDPEGKSFVDLAASFDHEEIGSVSQ
jgi:aspartyl aminopeptidase